MDKDMDHLPFKVEVLSNAVFDMQASGCKLAADFSSVHEDTVSVSSILGVDLLKYLVLMKLSRFMNGEAFELAQGFVLFGNRRFPTCSKIRSWSLDLWYELISGHHSVFWLPSYPYIFCVGA